MNTLLQPPRSLRLTSDQKSRSVPSGTRDKTPESQVSALTPVETEVIDLFVQFSHLLGQPRSLAELYGLLFISTRPLAMDTLIARLQLSKASASQGLKFLLKAGAITTAYISGDRRVHYEAVTDPGKPLTKFLHDRMLPQMDSALTRLDHIAARLRHCPPDQSTHVHPRFNALQTWAMTARRMVTNLASSATHTGSRHRRLSARGSISDLL